MQKNVINLESKPATQFFSFAIPSIVSMLLTSGIVIIDGLFIGNIIGKSGLAAVNVTLPVLYLFLGITIMIGVGGAVKAGHALGAGDREQAGRYFTSTLVLAVVLVTLLALLCSLFFGLLLDTINTNRLLHRSVEIYLGAILWFYPVMMVNIVFIIFLRVQGKPGLSLFFGVAGNALNITLDYVLIVRYGMGLHGAALASGISVIIPMCCGIFFFLSPSSVLQLTRFPFDWRDIGQTFYNGSSEMIGQISIGITTWIFNLVLLSRLGIDGVAVYTIVGYVAFVQMMIITGFATGLAPIVGYSFGAGNIVHIRRIMKIALVSAFITGAFCWVAVLLSSASIAAAFSPGNEYIKVLAKSGFSLFAAAFLMNGFNILVTAYFTSIGKAGTSFFIAFLRGLLLINLFVLLLPELIGDTGIWISYPLSELLTLLFSVTLLKHSYRILKPARSNARTQIRVI